MLWSNNLVPLSLLHMEPEHTIYSYLVLVPELLAAVVVKQGNVFDTRKKELDPIL